MPRPPAVRDQRDGSGRLAGIGRVNFAAQTAGERAFPKASLLARQWQHGGWLTLLRPLAALTARSGAQARRLPRGPRGRVYAPVPVVMATSMSAAPARPPWSSPPSKACARTATHRSVVSRGYGVKLGPRARVGQGSHWMRRNSAGADRAPPARRWRCIRARAGRPGAAGRTSAEWT